MITEKFLYSSLSRNSVGGKRHYVLPDGSNVPSVTTILDVTKPQEKKLALLNWKRSVGEQKAQEIVTEASGRGTRMHKWLENYIKSDSLGQFGTNPYSKQSYEMAQAVIDQGLKYNVQEYYATEASLFYSGLYAGTTDCIANWKGNLAILDFKQTNKPKKRAWIDDYFLQLAAYALAHNNMFNTDINHAVILMCSKDLEYQEFELSGQDFKYFSNLWFDRLEQFYALNTQ
jgi:genome maintenance exonuclease 1